MAALNFVAAPDGLEEDPKLQMLARILKVSRPMAFWFVMRWQRLILRSGNHMSGSLPKNYTADDIAAFLEFPGGGQRLVAAMKRQGYLGYKRGRGFYYVGWPETITGRYASRREEDRLWHERSRKKDRATKGRPSGAVLKLSDGVARPSDDVVRLTDAPSADRPTTSPRTPAGRKGGNTTGNGPPDPPPAGGATSAEARWDYLNKKAPTPQNRDACTRILAAMTEDDWVLVQRAYGRLYEPGASISRKNRRVLQWPTDQFLRKQAYLRFQEAPRPARSGSGRSVLDLDPLADIEKRLLARDKFLAELHQDPEAPEAQKRQAREHWLADPENKDRPWPWEGSPIQHNGTVLHSTRPPLLPAVSK